MSSDSSQIDSDLNQSQKITRWLLVAGFVYLLLVAVGMIGAGFKSAAGDSAKEIFQFAENPFLGLLIGVLCTALIQSSSTVTSIIVGLVAGGLPVQIAIPMIMGANIGTTITNTLVSLGHVRDKQEFARAFSAATVHDFFNVMAVFIFLPLEIIFKPLQNASAYISSLLTGGENMSMKGFNFIKPLTKPVINTFKDLVNMLPESLPAVLPGIVLAVSGVLIIMVSITFLGKLLKQLMVGGVKHRLHKMIGRGPVSGISSGAIVTVLVQSSSTTTSLMVPLVGSGVFKLKEVYPFTLGANIGTTITALLAATAISGEFAPVALQIAVVHLLFNLVAVLAIYSTPLRIVPLVLAERFSIIATEKKSLAIAYILGVFFGLPGLMVFLFG